MKSQVAFWSDAEGVEGVEGREGEWRGVRAGEARREEVEEAV